MGKNTFFIYFTDIRENWCSIKYWCENCCFVRLWMLYLQIQYFYKCATLPVLCVDTAVACKGCVTSQDRRP